MPMKKYLFLLLITGSLYGCSKSNEFANHKFKVVSVAEIVTLYGAEVRAPTTMPTDKTLIWEFDNSELNTIVYNDQNVKIESAKVSYSIDGSFIILNDQKHEIRHNGDTIELYKGSNLVYQLVRQD